MRPSLKILILTTAILGGCVSQFIPDISEEPPSLVVEGLITDRDEQYDVNLTLSQPFGSLKSTESVNNFIVKVADDAGNEYTFENLGNGQYVSDSLVFRGIPGRKYTLLLSGNGHTYRSSPMELRGVPPIDSIYAVREENPYYYPGRVTPGYQVYINTFDPSGDCRFFRWDFTETWEFKLPYLYPTIINRVCWKSEESPSILIKSTASFSESRIEAQPVNFITMETDRLMVKYSILVKQYAIDENEFIYWENLRKTVFDAGGLYDAIPSTIKGNLYCTDDPSQKVLGFFSVSSVSEKRIFLENIYERFPDFYASCPFDTILVSLWDPNVHQGIYILQEWSDIPPDLVFYILSHKRECVDCSLNGTPQMPDYWNLPDRQTVYQSLFHDKKK